MADNLRPLLQPMLRWIVLLLGLGGGSAALYAYRKNLIARLLHIEPPRCGYQLEKDIAIPMRDGVRLYADHYAPSEGQRGPVVLIRSPYGRNLDYSAFGGLLGFFAMRFAERGYHVIVQDVRGRCTSEGEFDPYLNEKEDGQDTVAWLREQLWFDGQIVLWGSSYLGIVQWALADCIPEIKAMMPIFTSSHLKDIIFPDGVFDYGLAMRWVSIFQVLDEYAGRSLPEMAPVPFAVERRAESALMHLPVDEGDSIAIGEPSTFYRKWMAHSAPDDPMWDEIAESINVDHISAAVHMVGGWYDFFLRGQVRDYLALRARGVQPYLTIGPWTHFSDLNGLLTGMREGLTWFDHHVKGTPLDRECPVRLYVMGEDEGWRDLPDYPPPHRLESLYLSCSSLESEPVQENHTHEYTYDPADPTPMLGGNQFRFDLFPVKDNRVLEQRSDVLVFTGDVLNRQLEIMGPVRAVLYAKTSAPSTDFFARLCDVTPDGRSLNVCDGLFRIGPDTSQPDAEGIHRIEIDLWYTAYRFAAGHRVRLLVSSGAHPRWLRNTGTGEHDVSGRTLVVQHETVFTGGDTPSHLILPVTMGDR